MRMSSGASAIYEKPREPSSSCGEETPRSKSIPSILSRFRASRIRAMFSKLSCTSVTLRAWRLSRFFAASSATSSRSTPMQPAVCQTAADFQRVPAAAERSVQIDAVRTDVERRRCTPKATPIMRKLHQKPIPPSPAPDSPASGSPSPACHMLRCPRSPHDRPVR